MKEKFLAFFTGKAGKAAYMIAASAAVCAVAVVSTVVVVHNNNQKLNTALESLSALTSQSESESVTEPSTEAEQTQTVSAQAANSSSGGSKQEDKAIQYLAEYNRLTEEYEKKRAALEQQTSVPEWNKVYAEVTLLYWETDEEYEQGMSECASINESLRNDYEAESASVAAMQEKANAAKSQLEKLEAQYQKDLAALKAKYGV